MSGVRHRRRAAQVEDQRTTSAESELRPGLLVWNGTVASIQVRGAMGVPCADAPAQIRRREAEAAKPR